MDADQGRLNLGGRWWKNRMHAQCDVFIRFRLRNLTYGHILAERRMNLLDVVSFKKANVKEHFEKKKQQT